MTHRQIRRRFGFRLDIYYIKNQWCYTVFLKKNPPKSTINERKKNYIYYHVLVGGLVGFYATSILVGYWNPFLYISSVLFQTIQFSMRALFNCQSISISSYSVYSNSSISNNSVNISIVFVHTQLHVKTVLFQTIQFSISFYHSGSEWTWER